jgi:outer membrane protein assembly factor BamB
MTRKTTDNSRPALAAALRLSRRAALLGPLSLLGGCGLWDDWFSDSKKPLPGKRESLNIDRRGLVLDADSARKVVLPPPVANAAWPQAGGNPTHLTGHLAAGERLAIAWTANIGEGGGYRRKILAQPVIAGGLVYTMDSDAVVCAFDTASGERRWRFDTRREDDDSTNVGGGLGFDQGVLYVVNGLADILALDADKGTVNWRHNTGMPARSAPTISDGRVYYSTIDDHLVALAAKDGKQLWAYQGPSASTSVLGQPAPACAEGLVVAGFGSGELATLRADTGAVAWTDSLAAAVGHTSLSDLSAIRGRPVIANGRVYAIGLGALCVGIDLRTGRRLWERDVASSDSPWVAGDWMFILTSDLQIAAVNIVDGRAAWLTDLPRYENEEKKRDPITWFGPILAGDRLIVAGTNREALAISPYTGEILGKQELPDPASLAPVAAGGTVYVVTDDASLLALR